MMLETKRLRIVPLAAGDLRLLLDDPGAFDKAFKLAPSAHFTDDADTSAAMEMLYYQMLRNPQQWIWNTNWQIILKSANTSIGSACFTGPPNASGNVEVGYGIDSGHRGKGYMTEALEQMLEWAFAQRRVSAVNAQTETGNVPSHKVLRNCGMSLIGPSGEGLMWRIDKNRFYANEKMKGLAVISVRENPEYKDEAIDYISSAWPSVPRVVYESSISESIYAASHLPQWYLLQKYGRIIGCAGLITNDFVSRMDLHPWVCALYIEDTERGNSYASLLLERAREDCIRLGFSNLYLTTDLRGFYEKYGYSYLGTGYYAWDEQTHIYYLNVKADSLLKSALYTIRTERAEEAGEIYKLIHTAFSTAKVKDGTEQDFAAELRESDAYIPELALVAESDGKPAAHIMLTKTYVESPAGKYESLLLAPVSVLLEHRDKGVGSMLIIETMRRAREMGWKSVFLCGDPAYYHRFGFRSLKDFGIGFKGDIPSQYVMACELEPDALKNVMGTADFC